ncbi:putative secreted protein (Por secretion system target) [Breznakibacter xylanolyticus]|uniref:Putative secreted protein (Por secretion system target) n=1 Tax=Breznakibacter xylanolyticus TaxID=990 RepID=A0A2W7PBV7_9BACT|nr:family 16 glycosylhydrolase [Breznakibacter xylanolyticus]PZX20812.1 putative secreted protein (Por secretion system target) [Breznakibacter xylanolyticus]
MNFRNPILAITLEIGLLFMPQSFHAQSTDYRLVWFDEFDGTSLNPDNWTCETGRGNGGWGTGQLDYATDTEKNVKVDNGTLKLTLRNDGAPDGNATLPYTSGRLISFGKQSFLYGRIEARIKGVDTQGLGFAFWTLGDNFQTRGFAWPRCGEIDIMENTGKTPSYNIGTLHYSNGGQHAQSQGNYTLPDNQKYHNDFHIFGIEWTPDYIWFYVDDHYYFKRFIFNPMDYEPFHKPQFLILSTGVGGSYSGAPDASTVFPMTAEIDWVRVYQKSNASSVPERPNDDLRVTHNATTQTLTIDLANETALLKRVDILNLRGQCLQTLIPPSPDGIQTDDLPNGIYLVKGFTDNKVHVRKFVKR